MSSPLSSWGLLAHSFPFSPLLLSGTVSPQSSMTITMAILVHTRGRSSASECTRGRGMRGRCTRDAARPACETFNLLLNPFTAQIFPSTVTVTFRNLHASHGREKFENIAAFHSGCCERRRAIIFAMDLYDKTLRYNVRDVRILPHFNSSY